MSFGSKKKRSGKHLINPLYMRILIATHNKGKLSEILEVLGDLPHEFVSLSDLGISEDVEETGTTHEENAIIKAKFFHEKTGLPTIAEDSGIYVDAFPGDFGVYTRRWKGLHEATDEQWITHFLSEISKISPEKRTAKFICCAAFIPLKSSEHVVNSHEDEKNIASNYYANILVRGETFGRITDSLLAPLKPGIPISSCFIPDGFEKVYAALSVEEKNKISHRGKAMHQLKNIIYELGNGRVEVL